MNEELEEQASLYALDLLEPEQIAPFEAEMARDPELRARVDDLRETAAQYAHAASLRRPPAHLESQILAAIKADAPKDRAASRLRD
jgi:anti-sigma-K factor RskA